MSLDPKTLTSEQLDKMRADGQLIPVDFNDPQFLKTMFANGRPVNIKTK
jgi:hypothetical protein